MSFLLSCSVIVGIPAQNLRLERQVIGAAAMQTTTSDGLRYVATMGETITPTLASGTLRLSQGFHQVISDCQLQAEIKSASTVLTCLDSLLVLEDGNPGSGVLRQWRNAAGMSLGNLPTITVNLPGVYILELTSGSCTNSDTLIVTVDLNPPFLPLLMADTITCQDTLANLYIQGNPGQNTWLLFDPLGQPVAANPLVPVTLPGWYTLQVTGPNGCSDTTGVRVIASDQIPQISITKEGDLNCSRDSVLLIATSATATSSYQWTGPDGSVLSSPSFYTQIPGAWQIILTDTLNGCSSSALINISLDTLTPLASLLTDTITCRHPEATLITEVEGSGLFTFHWTGPDGQMFFNEGPEFSTAISGLWQVIIRNELNGCEGNATIMVPANITIPEGQVSQDEMACLDEITTLRGFSAHPGDSLIWFGPNGQMLGTGNQIAVNSPGNYTLQVMDAQGCTVEIPLNVLFTAMDDLPTIITPNGDGSNDVLDLHPCPDLDDAPTVAVTVFNRWGSIVFQDSNYRHNWGGTYNGKLLPTGQYYYIVRIGQFESKRPLSILY